MSPSWPPTHQMPTVPRVLHLLGRFLMWIGGWHTVGQIPPDVPKAVLIAAPHTSNWDFWWALLASWVYGVRIQWLGKHTLFRGPQGPLLRATGGMAVERASAHGLVGDVAALFRASDGMLLMVPAEGTRSYRDYWKSGFYHIAREAEVPILLGYLDYAKKEANIGVPFHPTGDLAADMDEIRAWYADRSGKYPEGFSRIRLRGEDEAEAGG